MNDLFLKRAISLAANSVQENRGGPFGALIVQDGAIIAEGWNQVTTANDPTAHAEVVAIRNACATIQGFSLKGCEIYASCEPCPMCLAAIYWARIECIYFAASAEDAREAGFDDAFFYEQLSLPVDSRRVPQSQHLRPEAQAVFNAWLAKEDRVDY